MNQSKGWLNDEFDLVQVDTWEYRIIPTPNPIYVPDLLSLSEFKKGKPGYALLRYKTQSLVFGPEKFGSFRK